MSYTLGDIVSGLPSKGGGRQNWGVTADNSIGIVAAMQAVQEITETAELEELKYQTPVPPAQPLVLTTGNPIISIASLLGTIQTNTAYPQFQPYATLFTDVTDQYDGWLWFQGNGFQPNAVNQSGRVIEYRRVPAVDMYTYGVTSNTQASFGTAPSVYYTRFNQNYQIGPSPDQNYPFFFRLKLRHPFPATTQAAMPIFAPDTWKQIFQYAAILQLAKDEGISSTDSICKTATEFMTNRGMDMYTLRQVQMRRDERHNQRSLSLRTARYTHA